MVKAIILLGGNGTRISSSLPKQFIEVNGKPLFYYSVKQFEDSPFIDGIILVSHQEFIEKVRLFIKEFKFKKVIDIIEGGETRQESVYHGLSSKTFSDDDVVLIHDSARANISLKIIEDNVNASKTYQAVLTAVPAKDTMYLKDNSSFDLLDRNEVYSAQTPQTFRYNLIREIHNKFKDENFTDDISMAIKYGVQPYIVIGSDDNYKITTPSDLKRFIDNRG